MFWHLGFLFIFLQFFLGSAILFKKTRERRLGRSPAARPSPPREPSPSWRPLPPSPDQGRLPPPPVAPFPTAHLLFKYRPTPPPSLTPFPTPKPDAKRKPDAGAEPPPPREAAADAAGRRPSSPAASPTTPAPRRPSPHPVDPAGVPRRGNRSRRRRAGLKKTFGLFF